MILSLSFFKPCGPEIKIHWGSSAHLALYDVIEQTAKPNTLTYAVFDTNYNFEKISRFDWQQGNVNAFIAETIGKDLTSDGFKELPYIKSNLAFLMLECEKFVTELLVSTQLIKHA